MLSAPGRGRSGWAGSQLTANSASVPGKATSTASPRRSQDMPAITDWGNRGGAQVAEFAKDSAFGKETEFAGLQSLGFNTKRCRCGVRIHLQLPGHRQNSWRQLAHGQGQNEHG